MLNNIKSKYILNLILENLKKRIELKLVKYNKILINKLNIKKEDLEKFKLLKEMNQKFNLDIKDIEIDGFYLDGNYCFDSGKNIVIRNSTLNSKDSFWNSENVIVYESFINGEYLAWNSKNLTFINCKITSHQGLCYIKGLKMINCELVDSDLCFEYCEKIDAQITSHVDSIKNPYSGKIEVESVGELIMDEKFIDPKKTKINVKTK